MKLQRLRRDEKGATAVEFSMTASIFFMCVLAVFEFMNLYMAWSALQWSCDVTARYVMTQPASIALTTINDYAAARSQEAGYPTSKGISFSTTRVMSSTSTNVNMTTVTGQYNYKFTLFKFGVGSVSLSATAVAPTASS